MEGVQIAMLPQDSGRTILRSAPRARRQHVRDQRDAARARPAWTHDRHARQEEVYFVLEGRLLLPVEQEEFGVAPLQAVRVVPKLRRQLVNAGDGDLLMLALGGAERHDGSRWRGVREVV